MRKLVTNPVVGKVVTRWLAGNIPMDFNITEVTDDRIICGDWIFDIGVIDSSPQTESLCIPV